MPLTTYSQNFEDVMLWRALWHVEDGFYIDIGAQDPVLDSVSYQFHTAGWRGIHIEPNSDYAARLKSERPGDVVIEAAVAAEPGLIPFFSFPNTGLSTADRDTATSHLNNGFAGDEALKPCITLDMVFEYCGDRDVHWLKLDVEGLEGEVIAGWRMAANRPWIIVVEAIIPGGRVQNEASYEAALCAKGYHFVYFDGLNRFYVSDLHPELDHHFSFGPSLWDEMQVPEVSRMARELQQEHVGKIEDLSAQLGHLRQEHQQLSSDLAALHGQHAQLQAEQARDLAAIAAQHDQAAAIVAQQLADANAERDRLTAQTHASGARFDLLMQTHANLTTDLSAQRAAYNTLQEQLEAVRTDHLDARTEHAEACKALELVGTQVRELEAELRDERGRTQTLDNELRRQQTLVRGLYAELGRAQDSHRDLIRQHEVLRVRLSAAECVWAVQRLELEQSLAAAAAHNATLSEDITAWCEQSATTASQNAQLEQQLHDAQDRNRELDGQNAAQVLTLAEREQRIRAIETEHRSAQDQVNRLIGTLETIASGGEKNARVIAQRALDRLPQVVAHWGASASRKPARSVDELLHAGQSEFLDAAYITLLGRSPDRVGLNYYLARLGAGTPRPRLLFELARSAEAKQFGAALPGLDRLQRRHQWLDRPGVRQLLGWGAGLGAYRPALAQAAPTAVSAVADTAPPPTLVGLLGETDDFVGKAYQALLRRDPDPAGLAHFEDRLAIGDQRLDVLAALRWSPEGRSQGPVGSDFEQALGWYLWRKWPLVGTVLRNRALRKWMPPISARFAALHSRLEDLAQTLDTPVDVCSAPLHVEGTNAAGNTLRHVLSQAGLAASSGDREALTVCTDASPSGTAAIWFPPDPVLGQLSVTPMLPEGLRAIATSNRETAHNVIDKGVGLRVTAVGSAERGPVGQTALRLVHLAERLAQEPQSNAFPYTDKLRLAVLTTWNTRCGIATHSSELIEGFDPAEIMIFAPEDNHLLGPDDDNVQRLWVLNKQHNALGKVLNEVIRQKPDLIVVQFNFGFYNHGELNWFLKAVADAGICVMPIFHSTQSPMDEPEWRLQELIVGLAACARIIVHSEGDRDLLHGLGLTANVLLLPHGIRPGSPLSERTPPPAEPTLATFGFCLPNKGMVEFIDAVAELRQRGRRVRAKMLNALHPDPSSAATLQLMREAIARHGLDDAIEVRSEFMDMDTIDQIIAKADLFVNPYQHTGESASGAVRIGLRNKVPIVVTPLPIFDDLGDLVFRTPGITPGELATGIDLALTALASPAGFADRSRQLDVWLDEHRFSTQARRLTRIARSLTLNSRMEER